MACKNSCAERVAPVKRQIRQARDQERQNCLFENASCFTSNNNVVYTPWHLDALPPSGLYSLSQGERGLYHQSPCARVALYCLFLLNILVSGRLANGAVASVHVASVPWHGSGIQTVSQRSPPMCQRGNPKTSPACIRALPRPYALASASSLTLLRP